MNKLNKVGIVTLHGYFNYGNKLQNYALKFILEKLGFRVSTTIINDNKTYYNRKVKNKSINIIKNPVQTTKEIFNGIINKANIKNENSLTQIKREEIFKEFSQQYLDEKFYDVSSKSNIISINQYSYFVTGSDQVWNPDYYEMLPIYFLTFIGEEKRIAYAPSISRDLLPTRYMDEYKRWLVDMAAVSIREEAGADIIHELTGNNVPVLVDPTMLLNKDEWLGISKRAINRPDSKYLLTYFLGGPSKETQKKLEKIAQEKNMTIINLGDITEKETYETGPSEFLDYINNASAFFTDSFHGVVFSIIFKTPFVVYERQSSGPSMYSRIETILDNFDMRDREAEGFDQDIFSMDFSGTQKVLEREYNKSINYLKEALRIEE